MAEGSGLELRQCGTLFVTKIRQAWREEHQAACVNGSAHGYRLMASVPRFVDPPRWSPEAFCLDHFSRKPKCDQPTVVPWGSEQKREVRYGQILEMVRAFDICRADRYFCRSAIGCCGFGVSDQP